MSEEDGQRFHYAEEEKELQEAEETKKDLNQKERRTVGGRGGASDCSFSSESMFHFKAINV